MTDTPNLPAPATPPATAAEAGARLDVLLKDPTWRDQMLSGSGPQVKEMKELIAKKSEGDKIAQLLDGTIVPPLFETTQAGELSTANLQKSVEWFKEAGLSDGAIRQAIEGKPVSRTEFDAVKRLREDRLSDAVWSKAWLAGDKAKVREMQLMNIVISGGYEEKGKAA